MKKFFAQFFFLIGCLSLPMIGAESDAEMGNIIQLISSIFFACLCVSSIFIGVRLSD